MTTKCDSLDIVCLWSSLYTWYVILSNRLECDQKGIGAKKKSNTSKLCDKPWAYWKSSVNWVCNVIISEITDRKLYLTCTINHQVRICHRWYIQDGNVIFMIPTTMTKLRYPLLFSLYPFSYTVSLTLLMMQTILILFFLLLYYSVKHAFKSLFHLFITPQTDPNNVHLNDEIYSVSHKSNLSAYGWYDILRLQVSFFPSSSHSCRLFSIIF